MHVKHYKGNTSETTAAYFVMDYNELMTCNVNSHQRNIYDS